MKRLALYLFMIVALVGISPGAWGQEGDPAGTAVDTAVEATDEDVVDEGIVEPPPVQYNLKPEFDTWLGARVVSIDGSKRAMEYGWPFSSPAGGLKLHYSPLPHRLDSELDWNNQFDFMADLAYSYKDMFKLAYLGTGLWHNLDHSKPQPDPIGIDRNPTAGYQVSVRDDRVFVRLKLPERPYHVFAEYRQFEKDGTIQQRFYNGANKIVESRNIDWLTRRLTAGINGHFGPIELEYSHRIKTFEPHKDVALGPENYNSSEGIYQARHNVVPETEQHADIVKIHTDLTGRVVASATLTNGRKENETSGATADYRRAFGDLTIIPFEHVTVAVRYRYNEMVEEVPNFVRHDFNPFLLVPENFTKDPLNNRTNRAEVAVRYAPTSAIAVKLEYDFLNTKRYNVKQWSDPAALEFQTIPTDQNEHTVKISTQLKPVKGMLFRGTVGYTYNQDPELPNKPQNAFNGRFDYGYIVRPDLNLDAHYRFAREDNNTANMKLERDNPGISAVWTPVERLAVTGGYDFFRYQNERDMRFIAGTGLTAVFFPVESVPYEDTTHIYYISAGYQFAFALAIDAEYHQSWSRGRFRSSLTGSDGAGGIVTTAGIGELTDMKIRETGGSIGAKYDISKGWGTSLTYTINDYQDLQDKPQNGPQDGTAHTVMLIVSKKW